MQNTAEQNYPGSVASCDTRPGNEMDLLYNAPEPTKSITCLFCHQDSNTKPVTTANKYLTYKETKLR